MMSYGDGRPVGGRAGVTARLSLPRRRDRLAAGHAGVALLRATGHDNGRARLHRPGGGTGRGLRGRARGMGGSLISAGKSPPLPVIAVPETLRALQSLASWWRSLYPVPLVGVTGSVGKTSTKELIATVLGTRYRVLRNPGNLNAITGVPLALLGLTPDVQVGSDRDGPLRRGRYRPDGRDRAADDWRRHQYRRLARGAARLAGSADREQGRPRRRVAARRRRDP